ncbi:MAG: hypothetical protein AYK18_08715 [Theionarchaea archaeon DG-70]|nr:MAG: hypothetical protein AYK18_08715 [Theionarchaea archaeon DG-70]
MYYTKKKLDRNRLWKEGGPLLSMLDMELTERCNNNCIHCYNNLPADDITVQKRELITKEIKEILKEAVSLGCLTVRFTGGEPLLRNDFEELYIFARKLGLKVIIFTNATLITEKMAELFTRIPPLEKIEITIYGMKKESYEAATRNPGSYEAAMQGITLLLEKKVPFVIKGVLLPFNREEIDEFETWVATIPWMDGPPSYTMFFDLRGRRDSENKNRFIKKLRISPQEGLRILTRRHGVYFKEMKEFCSTFTGPAGAQLFSCGAGVKSGCVDAYGYLQPCMMLRHPATVYDLKTGSLKDALNNFFPEVRKAKARNHEYLTRCARCFLRGLCEQCPAKSWVEHGAQDTPVEYFCEIAHSQARYLGLIDKDEKAWEVRNWQERIQNFSKQESVCRKRNTVEKYCSQK